MTVRRIAVLWVLLVCLGASAAESVPPSPPVSDPDADSNAPASTTDAAKPAAKAPAATTAESKGQKTENGDFKPSEQISEDVSVAYPVDI